MRCANICTHAVEIHSFALFADTILSLRVEEIESTTALGAKVLTGAVVSASGAKGGTFAISVYQGAVAASFTLEREGKTQTYSVGGDPQVRDAFVAHQTDNSRYLPERDIASSNQPAAEMSSPTESFQTRTTASSVTVTVDVLVGYTTNALVEAGSRSQMIAMLNLAISDSTLINTNSKLSTLRFRMVGVTGPYDMEDSDIDNVLQTIRNSSTSVGAELVPKRTAVGADIVMMITNNANYCGVASQMQTLSVNFKTYAFAVVKYQCAVGSYSFTHELGHVLGVTHNKGEGGPGLYSYSYGWRSGAGAYRSLMSYPPGTRLPVWSNPNVTYVGYACGDALDADNVKTLKISKGTGAGWYPAAMCSGLTQAYCTDAKNPNCQWTGGACSCTSPTGCITEMTLWDMAGPPVCGNSIIEEGEKCDNGINNDDAYCSTCMKASSSASNNSSPDGFLGLC